MAAANAVPFGYRRSGSGSIARTTTASRATGTSWRAARGDGAGAPIRASAMAADVSPDHGRRPVSASYITRPRP